ncbi:hypothetical protein GWK47_024855 [Chionoecetes opilio]|uniref:Uncharacterized protein n=1 Tax=Chionoecetes opilio TaxID=41210 RepID=A0A8J5CDF3_CHIOP|nr:hypothetical protein GWK47_024855 [Chionoecetes opilio]
MTCEELPCCLGLDVNQKATFSIHILISSQRILAPVMRGTGNVLHQDIATMKPDTKEASVPNTFWGSFRGLGRTTTRESSCSYKRKSKLQENTSMHPLFLQTRLKRSVLCNHTSTPSVHLIVMFECRLVVGRAALLLDSSAAFRVAMCLRCDFLCT